MFKDAVKNGILGLVVGDALGVPVEFLSREELERDPVNGMRAYGTHQQPAGTWSDDSSMALCLMESLTKDVDYADMMDQFLRWANEGYMTAHGKVFDIGVATQQALIRFAHGTPPLECGGTGKYDNGNGSLMRILPMVLYLHRTMGPDFPRMPEAYQIIHNASALTHAHPISLIASDSTAPPSMSCSAANPACGTGSRPPGHSIKPSRSSPLIWTHLGELNLISSPPCPSPKSAAADTCSTHWRPRCGVWSGKKASAPVCWRLSTWARTPTP